MELMDAQRSAGLPDSPASDPIDSVSPGQSSSIPCFLSIRTIAPRPSGAGGQGPAQMTLENPTGPDLAAR
jgi:hypothetical protein